MFHQLALLAASALLVQSALPGFNPNPGNKQALLGFSTSSSVYSDETLNFTTLSLGSLSDSGDFTVLRHPNFPRQSIRIKKTRHDWCDNSVASYTGYIDTTEARHIFFYFFESRGDPYTDDVIFWTNGGPGCTSSLGLFMELGPCRVVDANTTKYHPQSWNEHANIFFIDQPIGKASILLSCFSEQIR
jgi:carboxypeptidase C (cathepsin A)